MRTAGVRCETLSYYQQRPYSRTGLVLDIAATRDRQLDAVIEAIRGAT